MQTDNDWEVKSVQELMRTRRNFVRMFWCWRK